MHTERRQKQTWFAARRLCHSIQVSRPAFKIVEVHGLTTRFANEFCSVLNEVTAPPGRRIAEYVRTSSKTAFHFMILSSRVPSEEISLPKLPLHFSLFHLLPFFLKLG